MVTLKNKSNYETSNTLEMFSNHIYRESRHVTVQHFSILYVFLSYWENIHWDVNNQSVRGDEV